MATKTITSVNALETRNLQQIFDFYAKWDDRKILVGETSISKDWNTVDAQACLNKMMEAYLFMGATVMIWALGDAWGAYNMLPYSGTASLTDENAGIVAEALLATYPDQIGVNMAGLEFGGSESETSQAYWNLVAAKGYVVCRIPFKWARVMEKNGTIKTAGMDKLKLQVTRARAAGFTRIILDMHNYGVYSDTHDLFNPTDYAERIGGPNVSEADYQASWNTIFNETGLNESDIEYDLMNEPDVLKGNPETGFGVWESIGQNMYDYATITQGITNKVWLEGWNFSGVQDVTQHGVSFSINSVHDYPEHANDGTGQGTYATNNTSAANDGVVASKSFTFDNSNIPTADTVPPDTTITSSTTSVVGSYTLTGTASDAASGVSEVYARIQRLNDNMFWNGASWVASESWNLATGTTSWSYAMTLDAAGDYTFTAYSVDVDGNIEEVGDGRPSITVTVTAPAGNPTATRALRAVLLR